MKTRPWRYLVEFHHHNNAGCSQPPPKIGRGLIKVWGTGDLPLCAECERLNRAEDPPADAPALVEVADADTRRDPH